MTADDGIDRRRLLTSVLGVSGATVLAGCSSLPFAAGGGPTPEWTTNTNGDADADVTDGGSGLAFRVHKCSRARAVSDLGSVSGDLGVSFDYETTTEGYWEIPYLSVLVDGQIAYFSNDDSEANIDVGQNTTKSGTFEKTVAVDGDVQVALGIRPSEYCRNGDHGDTHFDVDGLAFSTP